MPGWTGYAISPPYKLSKANITGTTPDPAGEAPAWTVDLPFTQVGAPFEINGAIWVPTADITNALATGGEEIVKIVFVKIVESGGTAEVVPGDAVELVFPTVNKEFHYNLLYPVSRYNPDVRCEDPDEVTDQYGVFEWPFWTDMIWLGEEYWSIYGQIKNGGWLADYLWHKTPEGRLFAIPRMSHSPQLLVSEPAAGTAVSWSLDGSADWNPTGEASYEVYTPILATNGKLLVHYERIEWENRVYPEINPTKLREFEDWYQCWWFPTRHDSGVGDGETFHFLLSIDCNDQIANYNSFRGSSTRARVYVDGIYTPRFSVFTQSDPCAYVLSMHDVPREGAVIDIYYKPLKVDDDWICEVSDEEDEHGAHGDATQSWRCGRGCEYAKMRSEWCWNEFTRNACVDEYGTFDRENAWVGYFLENGCLGLGGNPELIYNAPDYSVPLGAINQIQPRLETVPGSVTLQSVKSWRHGYRMYALNTGSLIWEARVVDRDCENSFYYGDVGEANYRARMYTSMRVAAATYSVTVPPSEDGSTTISNASTLIDYGLAEGECGHSQTYEQAIRKTTSRTYPWGCFCFPEGCVETGGCNEYEQGSYYHRTVDGLGMSHSVSCLHNSWPGAPILGGGIVECMVGCVSVTQDWYGFRLAYTIDWMPYNVSKKLPWASWNACTDGERIYFGPGREFQFNQSYDHNEYTGLLQPPPPPGQSDEMEEIDLEELYTTGSQPQIPGLEHNEFLSPDPDDPSENVLEDRAAFFGFGCLNIFSGALEWFREIPVERATGNGTEYNAIPVVCHQDGVIGGVQQGYDSPEYPALDAPILYLYHLHKTGVVKEKLEITRDCAANFPHGDDLILSGQGALWWMEHPSGSGKAQYGNLRNIGQVWRYKRQAVT